MEKTEQINIVVCYASMHAQSSLSVTVNADSDILSAIQQSGILTLFPEINLTKQKVGIFGKQKQLTDKVQAGDRIEIYRPLLLDPKEARRIKSAKKI